MLDDALFDLLFELDWQFRDMNIRTLAKAMAHP
jgi:hypothetical protein